MDGSPSIVTGPSYSSWRLGLARMRSHGCRLSVWRRNYKHTHRFKACTKRAQSEL